MLCKRKKSKNYKARIFARFRNILSSLFWAFFLFAVCFVNNSYSQNYDVLSQQIRTGNTEQKREALFQIRNLRTEQASRLAIPALSDKEDIVRAAAAASVVFLPKIEASRLLIGLLKDKASFVRKEAAFALGEVGDAVTSLGEGNENDIASSLGAVLQMDKDPEVRSTAVIAMGKAGGLKSVEQLYFFLQKPRTDANEFLRRSAIRSIGLVAEMTRSDKRVIPSLRRGDSPGSLRRVDYSDEFRSFEASAPLILKILQDNSEPDDVRREAASALGHIGYLEAVPALTANLSAKDPYLAAASRESLEKLKSIKPF